MAKTYATFVYRVHPYVRVYCALWLVIMVVLAPKPTAVVTCSLIALVLCFAAQVPAHKLLLGFIPIVTMIAGLYILSLFVGNHPNLASLCKSGMFALRCWTAFVIFAALRAVSDWARVVKALEFLRLPVLLTHVSGGILRWVDTLNDEVVNVNNARLLRGGDRRSFYRKSFDLSYISVSLTIRSLVRAEKVANAMELRGFNGHITRSLPIAIIPRDFVPLGLLVVISVVLWWAP